jgi:thymidylate synthase (FAD)
MNEPHISPGETIHVLDHGFVRYIDHHGSDRRIVEAARISFRSPSKGEEADRKLIEYLYRNRHTSPFEMVKVTLNIKLPIFVMRQYVRHRMQNLNEVSARYTELPEEFYIPDKWRAQDNTNRQGGVSSAHVDSIAEGLSNDLREHCRKSYQLYQHMLRDNVAREMARMCLPVNIYTEIYACWDLKNLLHFITLREDAHAQAEIQDYGRAIKQILVTLFPWTMAAYEKFKRKAVEA